MRRFDFDPEAVVRLAWRGVRPVNIDGAGALPQRRRGRRLAFPTTGRDNALLTWMHARLFLGFLWRLPVLLWRRLRDRPTRAGGG